MKKEHKVSHKELEKHLYGFLEFAKRTPNIRAEIDKICDKITAWKKQFGDLDKQEKMVRHRIIENVDKVKIHNIKTKLSQISRFQSDIKLTDDEVMIIIFTSLDQDYFTHLIVSEGEFTQWFTLDFESIS